MKKHFHPEESRFFQDDSTPIYRTQGLSKHGVNHMLWPTRSPDPNAVKHRCFRQCSPPPPLKQQLRENYGFQTISC